MANNAVVRIDNLDDQGRGVARVDGKATFIAGALSNELVDINIIEDKKRFSIAQVNKIVAESSQRVQPPCPVYEQCGGCQLQHLSIEGQREYKQTQYLSQLTRIGQVAPQKMLEPLIGQPWHYRHRARLSVAYKDGAPVLGFKAKKSHAVVQTKSCMVLSEALSNLLVPIHAFLAAILPYQVREVVVHEGENAIALGLNFLQEVPAQSLIKDKFSAQFATQPSHKPLQLWIKQPYHEYKAILPAKATLFYELPFAALSIAYTPNDFTQINHVMNQKMVQKALHYLAPREGERIADFFAGLGNFSLPLAKTWAKIGAKTGTKSGIIVLSIEGVSNMVARGAEQARLLGLDNNLTMIEQDLFHIKTAQINNWGKIDKYLLDPPRAGAKELLSAIAKKSRPRKVVYVSCNPATLARDSKILLDKGYRFSAGGIVDLFPQTAHIESINVFERQ